MLWVKYIIILIIKFLSYNIYYYYFNFLHNKKKPTKNTLYLNICIMNFLR